MSILKNLNTALSFFIEVAMLVAFGYWGYHNGSSRLMAWLMAIGLPLIAAFVWWLFFAPKAPYRLSSGPGLLLSLALFLLAALAFRQAGHPLAGTLLAAAAILNRGAALFWRRW
ncbi:MAG: YrdB family protein [Caldilineaceae bacterium]|nr:YrdB family protein [Caldilineaceae bacterium]